MYNKIDIDEDVDFRDDQILAAMQRSLNDLLADMQEKREKRLWKKAVECPCRLVDVYEGMPKDELSRIRKNYNLHGLSGLKKTELAAALAPQVLHRFKNVLYTLDQTRYDLIRRIADNSGMVPDEGISLENAEEYIRRSILFTGIHNGEKVLYMPDELVNIFVSEDGSELKSIVDRNTEWILLTQGLLYYYGVMNLTDYTKKMEELTGRKIADSSEFMNILYSAGEFYGQFKLTLHGFKNSKILDEEKIINYHRQAKVEFYPFTKEQLLRAGAPGFLDKTPVLNKFTDFLLKHYDLSDEDINDIVGQSIKIINRDLRPDFVMKHLQSVLEFPSVEFVKSLASEVTELYNNTRQWAFKGHTPNEASMPLLFTNSVKEEASMPHKKIGRNDPCPCGSGKKYKKCCGRVN